MHLELDVPRGAGWREGERWNTELVHAKVLGLGAMGLDPLRVALARVESTLQRTCAGFVPLLSRGWCGRRAATRPFGKIKDISPNGRAVSLPPPADSRAPE